LNRFLKEKQDVFSLWIINKESWGCFFCYTTD